MLQRSGRLDERRQYGVEVSLVTKATWPVDQGSCYLDFFSTKVPPSDAFSLLKKLDKTADENFKEETQNTPKYNSVLFPSRSR